MTIPRAVRTAADVIAPIRLPPQYWRMFHDMIVLWISRKRKPLVSTTDLYPIVNKHYKSAPGRQHNPAFYLNQLCKEYGLLVWFDVMPDGSIIYTLDLTRPIQVGKQIVFTPDVIAHKSRSALAATPSKVPVDDEASEVACQDEPSVLLEPRIARGEPTVVGPKTALYYEAVMHASRVKGYGSVSPQELARAYLSVSPRLEHLPGITADLKGRDLLTEATDGAHCVVFRTYRIRQSRTRVDDPIDPPELESADALASEFDEVHEAPAPATPPPTSEGIEPTPVPPEELDALFEQPDPSAHSEPSRSELMLRLDELEQQLASELASSKEARTAHSQAVAEADEEIARLEGELRARRQARDQLMAQAPEPPALDSLREQILDTIAQLEAQLQARALSLAKLD